MYLLLTTFRKPNLANLARFSLFANIAERRQYIIAGQIWPMFLLLGLMDCHYPGRQLLRAHFRRTRSDSRSDLDRDEILKFGALPLFAKR